VYLHFIGFTAFQSGMTVSIATASSLFVQPFAGHLADTLPVRATVLAGLLLAALSVGIVTFTSGALLIAVVVLAGIGVGTVWTNSDALVSSMATENALGASMGAAQSFKELGDMVGPLLVGLATQFFGVRVGFVSCAVLALPCLPLLMRGPVRPEN